MKLPKPILHVRLPESAYSEDEETAITGGVKSAAKDYIVLITFDSFQKEISMEVHWILAKELSEEKSQEIIELLKNME